MAEAPLLRAFRFQVTLLASPRAAAGRSVGSGLPSGTPLGDGAFQECSGLDIEMDVQDYQEGGRNDAVVRRVGRAKYQPLVLKRGMFLGDGGRVNRDLWVWLQGVVSGVRPVQRYDGIVEVMYAGQLTAAQWTFYGGLPAKLTGPQLNARTGEVAIEELHIAHEGLRLAGP
jgi:phage tail-like protein